ncbi:G2/mitotic-specific cyclin S13-7-like [Vicia villosa]|uniref:G2/mitotic-specific cyclin S13-7-like n=1 Tax=Vicia villosa TaxID=3911 RepID=UPI00273C0AC6|nr:G2/mitotic-specific cyclin S13-7-like [Vicia villosa]
MKILCFHRNSEIVNEDSRDHDTKNSIHIEDKLSDYDDDLYQFYHQEECQIIPNSKGYKVDSEMRRNVVDWLIYLHYDLELVSETLYLSVNILDRFLSKNNFEVSTMNEFKLIGITSLLLASKYEQRSEIGVSDLVEYSFTLDEICEMENLILKELGWILTVPTCYMFLGINLRTCLLSDKDKIMENMVLFFSELSLTHYQIVCDYKPSVIVASAVYCARNVIGRYPLWSNELKVCCGYSEENLSSCAKVMMDLRNEICRDGSMHVFKKFSSLIG